MSRAYNDAGYFARNVRTIEVHRDLVVVLRELLMCLGAANQQDVEQPLRAVAEVAVGGGGFLARGDGGEGCVVVGEGERGLGCSVAPTRAHWPMALPCLPARSG